MSRTQGLATCCLVAMAALALASTAWADDDDFDFHLDPGVLGGYFTDVDTDSGKFEEYRDLDSGFAVPLLTLTGAQKDGSRVLDIRAVNVRRRDARYTLGYDVPGSWSLMVDYNKIPHVFGNDALMLWTQTSPGVYELPDPMQQALQGALEGQFAIDPAGITTPFLSGLLDPYLDVAREDQVGLQRDRTRIRLDLGKMGKLAWSLDYTHENREGGRPFGTSFGFSNVTELPEPISYDTTGVELAGEWNGKSAGARFGYRFNRFENDITSLTWDNPFRATDSTDSSAYSSPGSSSIGGSSRGQMALAPDSDAGTLFVDGRAKLGDWGFIDGGLSFCRMEQDEDLLPYTINSAIDPSNGAPFDASDPANLPQDSAGAEALSMNAALNFGVDVTDRGQLLLRYRLQDYDNESDHVVFEGYTRFDAVWEEIGRQTVPYGFSRQDVGLEFDWDIGKNNTLGLGIKRQSWDRDFREISSSDEDVAELTFDSRAIDWLTLRASLKRGDRSTDAYRTEAQEHTFTHPEGINNQPGLRKFDEAERTFDGFALSAQMVPGEGDVTIFVGLNGRSDDYDESAMGLIKDEIVRYVAEVAYDPSDKVGFYVFAERDDREVFQRARQSGGTLSTNPQDGWEVTFDEETDTYGFGLHAKPADDYKLNAGASYSKSDGGADFFSPPGGTPDIAIGFGNYEDVELLAAWVKLDVELTDHCSAGVGYLFEDYTIDSFINEGLQDYEPGSLLLNPSNGDYQASVVTAKVKFKF